MEISNHVANSDDLLVAHLPHNRTSLDDMDTTSFMYNTSTNNFCRELL
jgi:hypothetical protein